MLRTTVPAAVCALGFIPLVGMSSKRSSASASLPFLQRPWRRAP
ncbi:unnamed protein product [Spirodela intermedia]|uniref:Uncharacterized protein n=1 Tax=Spirodela intermedia TaxID=51605 RepID=A0A7I8K9D6_SPIIN|nr:unnamed protein product [Spirodela intermedia]